MQRRRALALLCGCWLGTVAFAPPPPRLPYDVQSLLYPAAPLPVRPGEQYPPEPRERATAAETPIASALPRRRHGDAWFDMDASLIADSNFTNGTPLKTVPIELDGTTLPAAVDPRIRERSGFGGAVSASAGARVPLSGSLNLLLNAEGYTVQYRGGVSDDASALAAAGVEHRGESSRANLQLLAFGRRYGGVTASRGFGLRGNYRVEMGPHDHLGLYADARRYSSGYGHEFGGWQGGAWLSYDTAIDPSTTLAGGLYGRVDKVRDRRFASTEYGAYASLTRYLTRELTAGLSGGLGRTAFEAPIDFLSPRSRRDWRGYASVFLATRRPVLWGLTPSLTYTYNRTDSSTHLFDTDRHRLRLGLAKSF
jgi:hypothetical protein